MQSGRLSLPKRRQIRGHTCRVHLCASEEAIHTCPFRDMHLPWERHRGNLTGGTSLWHCGGGSVCHWLCDYVVLLLLTESRERLGNGQNASVFPGKLTSLPVHRCQGLCWKPEVAFAINCHRWLIHAIISFSWVEVRRLCTLVMKERDGMQNLCSLLLLLIITTN